MVEILTLEDVEQARERAVAVLREGRLVVVPTDTVYGVVADAFQPIATRRLIAAKGNGRNAPPPVLIRTPRQVNGLVNEVPETAERLMAAYWPGPLTLVFCASEGLSWDLGDSDGTVGLRLPADDFLMSLVAEVGPLACTAAKGATTAEDAAQKLGTGVHLAVDGGARHEPASTVVDVSGGKAEVLREGAVRTDHVDQVATGAIGWGQRPAPEGHHDGSLPEPAGGHPEEG